MISLEQEVLMELFPHTWEERLKGVIKRRKRLEKQLKEISKYERRWSSNTQRSLSL